MMIALEKRLQFARALRSRPYAMLWLGQTISNLGDGIFAIALAWQVLLMTHSGLAMGTVLVAAMIPRLIFVLIGGVAADRFPRRLIILWSDGGRGVIVLLVSIMGFMGLLQFWQLVVEAFIFGVVDGFFNPAVMAITPDLVEKDDLTSANALSSLGSTIAQLLGPIFGAGLIAVITPMGAFAVDAVSFFVSVGFLLSVRIPEQHMMSAREEQESLLVDETSEGDGEVKKRIEKRLGFRGVVSDVKEGFDTLRQSRWLWVTTVAASFGNIGFTATLGVATPKLVHDVYGQGAWLFGTITACSAIGSMLGLLFVGQATRLKRRGLMSYLSMAVSCVGIIILGLPFPRHDAVYIAPLAGLLVGFGLAFFNTIFFTVLQEIIPREKLGRVISLDTLGSYSMIPVGDILGGFLTDRIGPAMVYLVFGILNLISVLIPLLVKDVRNLE